MKKLKMPILGKTQETSGSFLVCKSIFSYFFCLFLFTSFLFPTKIYALTDQKTGGETVSGKVGNYYLNLSGFIAPNASVVLLIDSIVLRSTVADQNGYFYITGVLINKGVSTFCLDAIDFQRLGESYTCIPISPAQGDITINDIFLPPTLGLQRTEVGLGDDAIAWGYSMPGAQVSIYGSDGKIYSIKADQKGYYEYKFRVEKAGKYDLFTNATYQNKKSKDPNKKVTLTVLSQGEQLVKKSKNAAKEVGKSITGSPWGILFFLIPLLILILILLKKLKPEWFTFIEISSFAELFQKLHTSSEKKLHHAWFVGY